MIWRNQKGFSIVQMLVVVAILSVLLSAFTDVIVSMQKEVGRMKRKQDRVLINHVIDQALTSQIGIEGSAELLPANEMLKACILGGPTSTCTTDCCVGEVDHDFFLLDPRDSTLNVSARARLGGTTNAPAYFDNNSDPGCTGANCLFHVTTKFTARCPGGIAKCDHAESLNTTLEVTPEPGKESTIKAQKRNLLYFVNLNYKPFITQIVDQNVASGADLSLSVYGNSGHPSEVQNFIFEKCQSTDIAIATVTCYGFMNSVGTIVVHGVAAGTTKITLQINDGGIKNNLSDDMSFNIVVTP